MRQRLIEFLGGECDRCGFRDHRGILIVQPVGQRLRDHQLYTMMLHDPELAKAELRVICATCRQIEQHEYGRDYHSPTVAPSISVAVDHPPSPSLDHPSASSLGGSAARAPAGDDADGAAFVDA